MGMYDTITIQTSDLPIPTKWKYLFGEEENYQTKSLDNSLTHYVLYKGKLLHEEFDVVEVPEERRPYPNEHKLSFLGSLEYINKRLIFYKFTGEIIFYTSFDRSHRVDIWFEFSVKIVDGYQEGDFQIVEIP
jgi:hypothetical protein